MVAGIADTHTALWHLYGHARLSATARTFIENAAAQGFTIDVPPISLAEIVYLVEKSRIPSDTVRAYRSESKDFALRAGKPLARVTLADLQEFADLLGASKPASRYGCPAFITG